MTDVLHEPRDLKGRWTHLSSEAPEGSSPRAVAAFGKGFSALFPADSGPTAISPWQHAGRRIDEPLYDKALVAKALVNPHYQPVDPRNLHSIQDGITKAGLRHYLSDPNKPFDPNNSDPAIVYVRARNRQKVILAGHHRAAAALVKGQPFYAIVVREPGTEDVMLANIDLTRHVRTPAGVERYHLPIGSPIGRRDRVAAMLKTPRFDKALTGVGKRGRGVGSGTVDDPVNCAGNVVLAAKLLSEGKHIRLNREAEVGTLLDRLAFLTTEAARKGKAAPNIDLCKVSVPKTNLFCAQSKGIPRAKMPQLGGKPIPGSKADALPKVRGGEVDILPQFRAALTAKGIKVTDKDMRADHLKATQSELVGPKVAGIYEAMKAAPADSGLFERIYVTRDGYVIDGHHRWAAQVGLEATKGTPADKRMVHVSMVDMEIGEALDVANAFAADWGIPQQGFVVSKKDVASAAAVNLSNIDLTRHVATPEGEARYHLPIGTPLGGRGDRGLSPETRAASARYAQRLTESQRYNQVDAAAKKAEQYAKDHPVHTDVKPEGNPTTVNLGGEQVPLDKAVKMVSDAYGWKERDREGILNIPGAKASVKEQDKAQIIARAWYSSNSVNPEEDKPKGAWQEYQNPELYSHIQYMLRTGQRDTEYDGIDPKDMRKYVDEMFQRGGYTTTKPMTVFRALKSKRASSFEPGDDTSGVDWAEKLKPGTEFTDKGIVSTTAHMRFSQGWLMNDAQGRENREPQKNDVVLEIRLPKGQRVVGGDPQFIETMLPPNTRLRVKESYPLRASAVDPLTHTYSSFDYTHVIAEVIPSE